VAALRRSAVAAVLVAACASAPLASADGTVPIRGSLLVTWHSDPAHCAADGLCGVQGAMTLPALEGGFEFRRSRAITDVSTFADSTTVRVEQQGAGAAPRVCLDTGGVSGTASDLLITRTDHGGRLSAHLDGLAASGRCAGPTSADLDRVGLAARPGSGGIDLAGRTAFHAGPFDGTVISTVRIGKVHSRAPSQQPIPPRARERSLTEYVRYDYRLTGVTGTLSGSFTAIGGPLCATLGACGARGTFGFGVTRSHGLVTVSYARHVRVRANRRQALRAAAAGTLGHPEGYSQDLSRSLVRTVVQTPGLPGCTASDRSVAGLFAVVPARHGLELELGQENDPSLDALRTPCPGPDFSDNNHGQATLAHGALPVRALGRRVLEVVMPGSLQLEGFGYRGHLGGSLTVQLTLQRVRAGTAPERKVPLA
jgi:hypothetical protein